MSAILLVRDLEKTFGSLVAVHDINVAVPPLQTVGIIGANGAGKTTFVNMITGHLRPSKGAILFEGRDITGRPSREITRLGIARSFQVPQVFASLTVFENMCIATAIAHAAGGLLAQAVTPLHSPDTVTEAEAALELFRIASYRQALAATLPQGVRKLLDIAMAVAGAPRVLLLDEPTSGISIEEKFELMDVVMAALKNRRITVVRRARHGHRRALRRPGARLLRRRSDRRRGADSDPGKSAHPGADQRPETRRRGGGLASCLGLPISAFRSAPSPLSARRRSSSMPARCAGSLAATAPARPR
jgi:branched-chain amino acid transport system ATP-binding protein